MYECSIILIIKSGWLSVLQSQARTEFACQLLISRSLYTNFNLSNVLRSLISKTIDMDTRKILKQKEKKESLKYVFANGFSLHWRWNHRIFYTSPRVLFVLSRSSSLDAHFKVDSYLIPAWKCLESHRPLLCPVSMYFTQINAKERRNGNLKMG